MIASLRGLLLIKHDRKRLVVVEGIIPRIRGVLQSTKIQPRKRVRERRHKIHLGNCRDSALLELVCNV
jgi:hypothetical protein